MAVIDAAPAANAPAGGQSFGTPTYRAYALFMLTLVYTLNFIDRNLLGVVAQPIIETFGLSDTEYGFLNGPPFALFYALMGIPIAMAADRFNRVAIMALCIAVWSLMTALCGFATGFVFLLIARIGVAIGEAGGTPPANSIIADYFKPKSRAHALAIYAMGVTIGSALASGFGGPIASLTDADVTSMLTTVGLGSLPQDLNWGTGYGWRFAFIMLGFPGIIVALVFMLTVKEPPRGHSDPPGVQRVEKASITETLKELGGKPTFWTMALGAALVALVGYGLFGFQAPMMQRLHGMSPGEFAIQYGVPLALASAVGTFIGGYLAETLTPRSPTAICWLPAAGLLISIPLYIWAFYASADNLGWGRIVWGVASMAHYSYLGAQYTIGQGVVSQRSRATAIAILLFIIALIGNGLGPLIVGLLSDMFMSMQIQAQGAADVLTNEICRARDLSGLSAENQAICSTAYAEGLRQSMAATVLFFIPAAAFFILASFTYMKNLVAKPV